MSGLLLVEDEAAIREKLVNNNAWADYGFDPVLSATNGLEALELLEKYPVQIMVTDVQMPKMNGIELITELQRRKIPMKIVVISGFAEFEYAQASIKLHVSDYLLKPFASRRLLEVVLRLKNELQQELDDQSELALLRQQLRENLSALKEKLMIDLLNGNYLPDNLPAQLDFLGLADLQNRPFQVVVLEIPESTLVDTTEEEKYLWSMQFFNQIKQSWPNGPEQTLVINYRRNQVVVIVFDPGPELPLKLEELMAQVRSQLNQSLACGLGHTYQGLGDLSISYKEACSALQYRYLYGLNRVFSINDLSFDRTTYHKIFYQLHQNPLFNDLKIGADSAIQADLKQFIAELQTARLEPEMARLVTGNLVLLAFTVLNELGYNPTEILAGDFSILTAVSQAESLTALEQLLWDFFEKLNSCIHHKRDSLNHKLMREIQVLLDQNYQQDLSLSVIASQYQISPSYLSVLFTEFTGKNFSDYLTERRMNKAQQLLKHSDLKIYEIANQVGYNDSFYFSNCFKKMFGLSPRDYREKVRDSE